MPNKLFIGNLSFNMPDGELNRLFAEMNIPVVNVKVMRDVNTGRSRGFAFAELAPEADMEAAIKGLNGKVLDGRALTVNEARPQERREPRGGDFGQSRGRFDQRGGNRDRDRGGRDRRDRDRDRGPQLY